MWFNSVFNVNANDRCKVEGLFGIDVWLTNDYRYKIGVALEIVENSRISLVEIALKHSSCCHLTKLNVANLMKRVLITSKSSSTAANRDLDFKRCLF